MKILLLITIVAIALNSMACANQNNSNEVDSPEDTDITIETKWEEEARQIVYMYPWYGNIPKGIKEVENAVNLITQEKINVKVTLRPVQVSGYSQQVTLALVSGEKVDVLTSSLFTQLVSQNKLLDITELVNQRGSGILNAVGGFIEGTTLDNKIYGITTMGGKAMSAHFLMRTDILKETGIDAGDMEAVDDIKEMGKCLETIEIIFAKVKEMHPEMIILTPSNGKTILEKLISYDSLGDELGVIMGGDNYEVVNLYETDEFRMVVQLAKDWYEKGYIMPNASLSTASSHNILSGGNAFATCVVTQQGVEAQYKQSTGYDFTAIKVQNPLLYTGLVTEITSVLPVSCQEPEAAIDFLNLMYTDKDLINLFAYGVEGKDYVFMEEGTVDYPDGIDANTSEYPCIQTWLFGNSLMDYVKVGNPINLYEIQAEANKTSPKSRAFGFTYDATPVKDKTIACAKIVDEYKNALLAGALDADKLAEFNEKLKEAGIEDIIAEKQRQLDEWTMLTENR